MYSFCPFLCECASVLKKEFSNFIGSYDPSFLQTSFILCGFFLSVAGIWLRFSFFPYKKFSENFVLYYIFCCSPAGMRNSLTVNFQFLCKEKRNEKGEQH